MKKIYFILVLLIPISIFSQKQGNIWYFGNQSGLNFNSGSPLVITGGLTGTDLNIPAAQEGTGCISDSSGALLFYTGGKTIWNRFHQVMPNGTGIMGGPSSTHAALIVPKPGSDSLFYVFTSDEFQSYNGSTSKGYRYSVVNMCLDNGKGDVVPGQKNILLSDTSTEKLAACRDAWGTGYWIVGHKMFSNQFRAWHLTTSGITSTVVSVIGTVHGPSSAHALGQMKFSSSGSKLALALGNLWPANLDLFDFNTSTGAITNLCHMVIDSGMNKAIYGLEFSPDGTKLYAAVYSGTGGTRLYQYDLLAGGGNCVAIQASRNTIYLDPANPPMHGMQLAPNNKIYLKFNPTTLSCIHVPNALGAACNFTPLAITISGSNYFTLPSFVAGYTYSNGIAACCSLSQLSLTVSADSLCAGQPATLVSGGALNYTWSTGASTASISITPSASAVFSVSGNTQPGCTKSRSITITVNPLPLITASSGSLCLGQIFTINAAGAASYTYSGNSATVSPTSTSTYSVWGSSSFGCTAAAPALLTVSVVPLPTLTVNSGSICAGEIFTIVPQGAFTYTISGLSNTVSPPSTSSYTVFGTNAQGCFSSNAALCTVTVQPLPGVYISTLKTSICVGESVILHANGAASYIWNGGVQAPSMTIAPFISTTFTLFGTDVNGCTNANTFAIKVEECLGFLQLQVNRSGEHFFPNPGWGEFSLRRDESGEEYEIAVYDLSGRQVFRQNSNERQTIINIKHLGDGVYLFTLSVKGRVRVQERIIKVEE